MGTYAEHLASLKDDFPRAQVLYPEQLAEALNIARQTVYNQHNLEVFPIEPHPNRGRWCCSIIDVAKYLATKKPYIYPSKRAIGDDVGVKRRGRKAVPREKITEFWNEVVAIMLRNDRNETEEWFPRDLPPNPPRPI